MRRYWYYMAMDEKGLGQRLQVARLRAGMTQQMLCQQAQLSYSTLTKIERGAIKSPSIFTIQSIATALGVGLDELLGVVPPKAAKKHHSKSGASFVYFDVNGCLVRFFHGAFTQLAADSGALPDVVETLFWHYNDKVCRGEMTMDEFNKKLAQELKMPAVDWLEYYMAAVEPIPVMAELVEWAAKYYRIGLLSNIMPGFINVLRERGLIPNIKYDVILDSVTAGAIKPEAKIFEQALKKANCPASEVLFIDDSRTNLMAAQRIGWHVLWFDDYRPDESVARVKEALEIQE